MSYNNLVLQTSVFLAISILGLGIVWITSKSCLQLTSLLQLEIKS